MSVKVNGTEYRGLAAIPVVLLTSAFVGVVFVFVSLVLLSPFILIGLLVWGLMR